MKFILIHDDFRCEAQTKFTRMKCLVKLSLKNIWQGLTLHWTVLKQLWHGESSLRVYEVFFESYPQLVFQTYLLFFIGIDGDHWSIIMRVITLGSSYLSFIVLVNRHMVINYFKSNTKMDYLKCFLYTFSDIHLRLLIYSISWVLLNEKHMLIYVIQTTIPLILILFLENWNGGYGMLGFLQLLSANICPQYLTSWNVLRTGKKNVSVYLVTKSAANVLYIFLLRFYTLWLTSSNDNNKYNIFNIDMGRFASENSTSHRLQNICSFEKDPTIMFLSKDIILEIFLPTTVALLALSWVEILFFLCFKSTWYRLIFGRKDIDHHDKIILSMEYVQADRESVSPDIHELGLAMIL